MAEEGPRRIIIVEPPEPVTVPPKEVPVEPVHEPDKVPA